MKKLFLFFLINCFAVAGIAQDSLENNRLLFCTAGLSFPVGGFASDDVHKTNAGLAKNGWNLEITYAHPFDDLLGYTAAFVYARLPVKKSGSENQITSIKPWEYYEFLIGSVMTGSIANRVSIDLSVFTGMAFINATKINLNSEAVAKKYSSSAVPLQIAIDSDRPR